MLQITWQILTNQGTLFQSSYSSVKSRYPYTCLNILIFATILEASNSQVKMVF